jgi:hypothetical protein
MMNKFINTVLWIIFALFISMCASELARAGDVFKLRYLDFEMGRYVGKNYDPYLNRRLPPSWPDDGSGLSPDEELSMTPRMKFNFDIFCLSYDELCMYSTGT